MHSGCHGIGPLYDQGRRPHLPAQDAWRLTRSCCALGLAPFRHFVLCPPQPLPPLNYNACRHAHEVPPGEAGNQGICCCRGCTPTYTRSSSPGKGCTGSNGMPTWRGVQVAVDTTLVSPVQCNGHARPGCDAVPGLARSSKAAAHKRRMYPELRPQG